VRAVLLDNEAVAAVRDPRHAKHRRLLAHLQAAVDRNRRGGDVRVVVPTAVRVEAGWDRTEPAAAALNRFRVDDHPLDTPAANLAAGIVTRDRVSVADAHLGATVRMLRGADVVVLTSDPADIRRASSPVAVRTVLI
jgi:hypothetical protein